MTLEDQMREYIAANKKPADAATWDQMCGSLMYRFNSWRGWVSKPIRDISSAFRVSQGSLILGGDPTRAPLGAFHFFDIGGPGNGHVMQDARGGGLVCLTTGYAVSEQLGQAIGFQSVPGYIAAKGALYIGWSRDYAGGIIDTSGLAGGGIEIIEEEDEDMVIRVTAPERGIGVIIGGEFPTLKNSEEVAVVGSLPGRKDFKTNARGWDVLKSIYNRDRAGSVEPTDRADEILAAIASVDGGTGGGGSGLSAAEYAAAVLDELARRTAS